MKDSLSLEFTVAATPAHAFDTWTRRMGTWWPAAKTVSGDPASLRIEPDVGGRVVEVDRDGIEHVWGQVLHWDRPSRLAFTWHLFFDPSEATRVDLSFEPQDGGTVVRLSQQGFARLGPAAEARRANTVVAWGHLTALYTAALDGSTTRRQGRPA